MAKSRTFIRLSGTYRSLERKLALLDRAEGFLDSRCTPSLPNIPTSWVLAEKGSRRVFKETKGYVRNDICFMWDLAGKVLPHICLEPLLINTDRRAQLLDMLSEFMDFTFKEIVPPFASSKKKHRGNAPYEWVFEFSAWCGKLSVCLTSDEVRRSILSRIWAEDMETSLMMMPSLMRAFMVRGLLQPADISDEHVSLWAEMAGWSFTSPEWRDGGQGDYLDREFSSCAFLTLFCVAPDFSPLICGIDPGWRHLKKFLPVIKRSICEFGLNGTLYHGVITFLKRGGIDLLPEPALAWLHSIVITRKEDEKFWEANGESTVELIKQLVSQKAGVITCEHRKPITAIADILVDDGVRGAGFLQQELLRTG